MNDVEGDIAWLLEQGADTEIQDINGKAAWEYACAKGTDQMIILALMDGCRGTVNESLGWKELEGIENFQEYLLPYHNVSQYKIQEKVNTHLF
jgi:ankyrin repeat protein